jgi:hypothetical protein
MTANYDAIRERLHAESQLDFVELWPQVLAGRAALLDALRGVSDVQARWRPPTGEGEEAWSTIEVAQHVISYTTNVGDVIEATGNGRTAPKLPPGHLDPDPDASLDDVRRTLTAASMRLVSIPERLPDPPDLATTVSHAAFGDLNCRGWFAFIRLHDGGHTAQIEALKQHEGFPA